MFIFCAEMDEIPAPGSIFSVEESKCSLRGVIALLPACMSLSVLFGSPCVPNTDEEMEGTTTAGPCAGADEDDAVLAMLPLFLSAAAAAAASVFVALLLPLPLPAVAAAAAAATDVVVGGDEEVEVGPT